MTARIVLATTRETLEGTDIECRYSDGQKYAPINVTEGDGALAQEICDWLNHRAGQSIIDEALGKTKEGSVSK